MLNLTSWDERREIAYGGDSSSTLQYCIEHFFSTYQKAILDHNEFYVALSGGSTPKAIYSSITSFYADKIDWSKVHLFWSDERSVPPENPDSNYHMAMEAGFSKVPIPPHHIHRMVAEYDIETHALEYEKVAKEHLHGRGFDLMMLGMGEDGHTASLFPDTKGLSIPMRWVIANFIPQKNTWRMTVTFDCINASRHIAVYVLGTSKAEMVKRVFTAKDPIHTFPVQQVGTKEHKALWILDDNAASLIKQK